MPHIYGRMMGMKAWSEFKSFWDQSKEHLEHPADSNFLKQLNQSSESRVGKTANFNFRFPPCPFDGPLKNAKVVICLANPNYTGLGDKCREIILRQRTGEEPLPQEWDRWYVPRLTSKLKIEMNNIRNVVSVLNVCPYESVVMEGPEKKIAAGLPSTWAAQKFLREGLIPRALRGELHLIVLRKHELWGITEGFESEYIHVERGQERSGVMSTELGKRIRQWLINQPQAV
jgi:hypothetical protein